MLGTLRDVQGKPQRRRPDGRAEPIEPLPPQVTEEVLQKLGTLLG
jgi:hypothetical protein